MNLLLNWKLAGRTCWHSFEGLTRRLFQSNKYALSLLLLEWRADFRRAVAVGGSGTGSLVLTAPNEVDKFLDWKWKWRPHAHTHKSLCATCAHTKHAQVGKAEAPLERTNAASCNC